MGLDIAVATPASPGPRAGESRMASAYREDMARPWARVVAGVAAGILVAAAGAAFLVAQRPVTMPRYSADDWQGPGRLIEGELVLREEGATHCWSLTEGAATVIALVFPDTYRSFDPSLAQRGTSNPASHLSVSGFWSEDEVARPEADVRVRARPITQTSALDPAASEWLRRCGPADVVVAVAPGSLTTLG